mgnify:CR=1 FL=1|tara:strand:+ start:2348 stop:2881 length:534 start_codon:yes stop_codon:yes gene_type:complete
MHRYKKGLTFKWKANPSGVLEFDFDVGGTLADGSQWQGAKGDLRIAKPGNPDAEKPENWNKLFWVRSYITPNSTPTAGNVATWRLGTSTSATAGTENDGGLSGTNLTHANTLDDRFDNLIFLGNHTFAANAAAIYARLGTIELDTPYVMPLLDNNLGAAIADHGAELWLIEKILVEP